jgi:hypothetical protein
MSFPIVRDKFVRELALLLLVMLHLSNGRDWEEKA